VDRLVYDVVVVGGGAAGLRAAVAAAEVNPRLSIAVVSKVYPMRSHTVSAEGGTAAVLKDYDSLDSHAFDTIKGSDFLADQDAVEFFVKRCPEEIVLLEHWGCPWSREADGRIAQRAFGGMSVKRTVFAADKVGFHILHTLFQHSLRFPSIVRHDEWFVTSLLVEDGRVHGLTAIDIHTGEMQTVLAKAVIIATGGVGRAYAFTTNGAIKTGDGMAMAYRAGVPLKDMEFIQYHPTGLPGTGILITEAARGEGGYLLNRDGERFLKRYVPNKMELGPRDMLSRAIIAEVKEGRAFEGPYGDYVHLDLTHLGEEVIDAKLPMVRELAEKYVGIDPVHEPIPVRPVVHYTMGGVATDLHGQTTIAGLYAAGEAACVSINGANRLGSNSLSECLVFGAEAGRRAAEYAASRPTPPGNPAADLVRAEEGRIFDGILGKERGDEKVGTLRREMQEGMEKYVGIHRSEAGLKEGIGLLGRLKERYRNVLVADRGRTFNTELQSVLELGFMLDVAEAIARAAYHRQESRGSHARTDFPQRDDARFLKHSLAHATPQGPRIDYQDVVITRWPPEERVY
jgi:succinate dehydrogenase/fumarate reductase flavoprotein subunit